MFELDSRLKNDTFDFGSFPLCRLLLLNDCSYPWFILVPQREALQEIYQLSEADRQLFWDESNQLSLWMKHYFNFDKLNIAALGNVVNQLHLHHVGRTIGDPAWPNPVWGHRPAIPYRDKDVERLHRAIQVEFADRLAEAR
ncbi:MAG: HIT domain-containing protein [Desulfuromusa sp.]|nr:HIT domain-containing protein [Desulfuromusa sp.]